MSRPTSALPRIAISMGDPGGVGPEVTARALDRADVQAALTAVVVGDTGLLNAAVQTCSLDVSFRAVEDPAAIGTDATPRQIPVLETTPRPSQGYIIGQIATDNGRAAHDWITSAVEFVRTGVADALVTAPIAKEAMFAAGFTFPGHTELLARLCGDCDVRMMLAGGGLRAVLETIHMALADVPRAISRASLCRTLDITANWAARYVAPRPRIAVCGLNPHAGEGGHFGNEEIVTIAPAVQDARERGLEVSGPFPADTIFRRMREGEFDFVVAMYHDQALIPVKTLDFHGGVNITLGLPIIRVSPDHGTAFNIAGRGCANESSMASALLLAASFARRAAETVATPGW